MKKISILFLIFILFFTVIAFNSPIISYADSLNDTIEKELEGLNLSELEDFFNSIEGNNQHDFYSILNDFIDGTYQVDYNGFLSLIKELLVGNFTKIFKTLSSIIIVAIIYSLCENLKSRVMSENVKKVIRLTAVLSILLILSSEIISLFQNVKIVINNMSKLNEIMSPIMLGLIVASGGKITASIYSPTVVFISSGFISIVNNILLPLIILTTSFGVFNCFSDNIKVKNFSEFFASTFKWVIGISVTVSGLFITVQGLNSAVIDGVSIKAAKYAISNSVPLIGGFLKDGFDIVTSGTIIIKNVIGVTGVIALFYLLLSPVLTLISYSMCFKLISAVIEPFSNVNFSSICNVFSKAVTYLIVCILIVALMFFINILILMISSSAFL